MNRQSTQSRGANSGTGVSVKSAKSGKSNHSQWSNNLNRNQNGNPQILGTANNIIASRGSNQNPNEDEEARELSEHNR